MTKYSVQVGLIDDQNQVHEAFTFVHISLNGDGPNVGHATEYAEKNRNTIPFVVDVNTIKCGKAELALAKFRGFDIQSETLQQN